jgi:micrococcal nuclease
MSTTHRVLLLIGIVALAGCSTSLTDVPATESPVPDTPATAAGSGGTAPPNNTALAALDPADTVGVSVTRVVDGDTIDVRFPDGEEATVRLVGIDSPEVHTDSEPGEYEGVPDSREGRRCLRRAGQNASTYLSARLDGRDVTLAFDPRTDRRGGYDRLLAYVYLDGRNLNHELVARGHARVYVTDFTFRNAFETTESAARSASSGLWVCRNRD